MLILTTEHAEHRCVIFVRKRDKERETWDGPRAGVDGAKEWLGADAAFPIGELSERLPEYLSDVRRLHYRLAVNPGVRSARVRARSKPCAARRAPAWSRRARSST